MNGRLRFPISIPEAELLLTAGPPTTISRIRAMKIHHPPRLRDFFARSPRLSNNTLQVKNSKCKHATMEILRKKQACIFLHPSIHPRPGLPSVQPYPNKCTGSHIHIRRKPCKPRLSSAAVPVQLPIAVGMLFAMHHVTACSLPKQTVTPRIVFQWRWRVCVWRGGGGVCGTRMGGGLAI